MTWLRRALRLWRRWDEWQAGKAQLRAFCLHCVAEEWSRQ